MQRDHATALPDLRDRIEEIAATGGGLSAADFGDIDACALRLWTSTTEMSKASANANGPNVCSLRTAGAFVDVWPVLPLRTLVRRRRLPERLHPPRRRRGNDTYMNNAGSNMWISTSRLHLSRTRPEEHGPRGDVKSDPWPRGRRLLPAVAALLDLNGNDTFGVKQTPITTGAARPIP